MPLNTLDSVMAEKSLLLQVLDQQWKEHLLQLEQLRQGISLRAYAQKDPLNEYKREAFMMFDSMLNSMRQTVTMALSHVEIRAPDASQEERPAAQPSQRRRGRRSDRSGGYFSRLAEEFTHALGSADGFLDLAE